MRITIIVVTMLFCMGCDGESGEIHVVVPNGYRGVIRIFEDAYAGSIPKNKDDVYVCVVPESGEMSFRNLKVFRKWHSTTASYANGDDLRVLVNAQLRDHPQHSAVGFHEVGVDEDGNLFFLVGTGKDLERLRKTRDYSLGSVISDVDLRK